MLDRAPKLFRAISNFRSCVLPQAVHDQACALSQSLGFLRTTRTILEHQDSSGKSGCFGCRAASSFSFVPDKSPPCAADVREMFVRTLRYLPFCICLSKATYCAVLAQLENLGRRHGKHGLQSVAAAGASFAIGPCIYRNSIFYGLVNLLVRDRRTQYKCVCISYAQNATYYGFCQ